MNSVITTILTDERARTPATVEKMLLRSVDVAEPWYDVAD